MQSVIVTGLSGLVGTRVSELLGEKYTFENMDMTVGVDITNEVQVEQCISSSEAHTVIHLAAFTNVTAAHEQNGDMAGSCYQVNVIGTENIARACAKAGKYLVHVSTDYVFDGEKTTAYTEQDTPRPIEWYGQTKLWAEEKVQSTLEQFAILRIAYPYQARPSRPDFLATMKEKLSTGTLPPAFTDHIITPVFVDDLATVFDRCIERKPTGIFHAVGSSWHSDFEIATLVNQMFELEAKVQPGSLEQYLKTASRPYQKSMKVSNNKIQQELEISMMTFAEGLQSIVKQLGS